MLLRLFFLLLVVLVLAIQSKPLPETDYDYKTDFGSEESGGVAIDKVIVRPSDRSKKLDMRLRLLNTNRLGSLRRYFEQHPF